MQRCEWSFPHQRVELGHTGTIGLLDGQFGHLAESGSGRTKVTIRLNDPESYWKVRIWTTATTRHIYRISPETAQTVEGAIIHASRTHRAQVPNSRIWDIQVAVQQMGQTGHKVVFPSE